MNVCRCMYRWHYDCKHAIYPLEKWLQTRLNCHQVYDKHRDSSPNHGKLILLSKQPVEIFILYT